LPAIAPELAGELAALVASIRDDRAIVGQSGARPASSLAPATGSDMFAGSTRLAIGRPSTSTRMWRFRPFTRLWPSKPRTPPFCSS
jgi:hypothetical protein